ncbi:MAG: hypothetical protein V8T86_13075 [Victivallis sp.]
MAERLPAMVNGTFRSSVKTNVRKAFDIALPNAAALRLDDQKNHKLLVRLRFAP